MKESSKAIRSGRWAERKAPHIPVGPDDSTVLMASKGLGLMGMRQATGCGESVVDVISGDANHS